MNKKWIAVGAGMTVLVMSAYFYHHRFPAGPDASVLPAPQETKENVQESAWEIFEVVPSNQADMVDGLIGTVKGDSVVLTFGMQEEKITAVHVRVGDAVERGQKLFEQDHTRALARLRQAQIAHDRVSELCAVGGATLQDAEESQALLSIARKDYDDTFICASKRGTISEILKREGETVTRNDAVAVLVSSQDEYYVETGVTESDIDNIRRGQKAKVLIESVSDVWMDARVRGVAKEVSAQGRTGTVHLSLAGAGRVHLRPGLFARCKIITADTPTLTVPRSAYDDEKMGVYVLDESGIPVLRPVVLGRTTWEYCQVLSGLNEGEKILTKPPHHPSLP